MRCRPKGMRFEKAEATIKNNDTMKKTFAIAALMALAMGSLAQENHYDFSAIVDSGQTLYFLKSNDGSQNVMVTYPCYKDTLNSIGAHSSTYYYGHEKPVGDLVVPSTVTHNDTVYTITNITNHAFYQCFDITSVVLPNTITVIGNYAFYNCIGIISVDFSNNLNTIGKEAFVLCTALEHIEFPETLTQINKNAFRGCTGLSGSITIPPHLTIVEEGVFVNCKISSVIFSEGVETIKSQAFYNCPLVSIQIPSTLTTIGSDALYNTLGYKFQSIVVDEDNPVYDSRDHCNALIKTATNTLLIGSEYAFIPNGVTTIGRLAFHSIIALDSITIPNSVERIEFAAFSGCDHLTAITIPSSVTYIGSDAFSCSGLTSITSKSPTPPTAFNSEWEYGYDISFITVNQDIPIYIPFGTTEAYRNAPGWDYFSNFIESETNLEGEWYYEILNDDGSITYQHLQCVGDTLFDRAGKRPKVIVRSNTHYDRNEITEVTHEYVYEENGIVYWWNKDLQEFTTLYNLNAQVGDDWEIKVGTESITMHVDAEETMEYEGRPFRVLHVSDPQDLFSGDIVCGIGHLTSFFPERLMVPDKSYRVNGLRCYWIEGELVFKFGNRDCDEIYEKYHHGVDESVVESMVAYPNPTRGVLFVETSKATDYRIVNLLGQMVKSGTVSNSVIDISALSNGIYFLKINNSTLKIVVNH